MTLDLLSQSYSAHMNGEPSMTDLNESSPAHSQPSDVQTDTQMPKVAWILAQHPKPFILKPWDKRSVFSLTSFVQKILSFLIGFYLCLRWPLI